MSSSGEAMESAIERIAAEAERTGGPVPYADVLRLSERCGVAMDQIPDLCQALAEEGIEIDGLPGAAQDGSPPPEPDAGPSTTELENLEKKLTRGRTRARLLTAEEEQELGRRIKTGQDAERRLAAKECDGNGALAAFVQDGLMAREKMVASNQGLVRSVANSFKGAQTKLAFDDLVSEGQLGLLRAISKWDHTRGLKFSTYATWWIFQAISRALADKGSLIRVPVHMHEHLQKYRRTKRAFERTEGREPSHYEVAELLGWPVRRVFILQRLDKPSVSLDAPLHGSDGLSIQDTLPSPEVGPDEIIAAREIQEAVHEVVEELPAREHAIIDRRFGLHGIEGETLEVIGADLGVTRERIRQIESKGLRRLMHRSRSTRLWEIAGEDGPCPDLGKKEEPQSQSSNGEGAHGAGTGNGEVRSVGQQTSGRRRKRRRTR